MFGNRCDEGAASYKVLTIIGNCFNGVGSVWLARHRASGNLVALKKYDLDKCDDEVFSLLKHEVRSMRSLWHANVAPCLRAFVLAAELWLVQPLCGYGSAKDLLAAHFNQGLPERAVAVILRDVLRALDYLHRQGVVHRSIRASHVLVAESGVACLSGLRSALWLTEGGVRRATVHHFPTSSRDALNWLSPELLAQDLDGYDCSSDIYSVGVLACELANGLEPFAQMPATAMLYEKLVGAGAPVLLDASTVDPEAVAAHVTTQLEPPPPPAAGAAAAPAAGRDSLQCLQEQSQTMMMIEPTAGRGEEQSQYPSTVAPLVSHHDRNHDYDPAAAAAAAAADDADDVFDGDTDREAATQLEATFRRVMRAAPQRRFAVAFHQLVAACVTRHQRRRPTAGHLLQHPFIVRQCKRAPPLPHLLRPSVPVNGCNLLEGEQIKSDSLMTARHVPGVTTASNSWDF